MSDPDVEKLGEAAAIPREDKEAHGISNPSFHMTNAAMPCANNLQDSAECPPTSRKSIHFQFPEMGNAYVQ